jgi:hypothetical protein
VLRAARRERRSGGCGGSGLRPVGREVLGMVVWKGFGLFLLFWVWDDMMRCGIYLRLIRLQTNDVRCP